MSDPWASLGTLEAHLWARLARAAVDAEDPLRTVALATAGPEGPQVRMVALRAVDPAVSRVEIHTDLRTPKIGQIRHDPRGQILGWDADARLQVRLSVTLTVVAADSERWHEVPPEARTNYGTDPVPGAAIDGPGAFSRRPARERFAALVGTVTGIDVVSLAHQPHRRARFGTDGGTWLAP